MTDKIIKIAIVGITGYGGLELLRLLYNHPNAKVVSIHNTQTENTDISEQFPHLKSMYNLTPTTFDPMHIMQEADLVFFATSSGVSKDLAQDFIQAKFPVIW